MTANHSELSEPRDSDSAASQLSGAGSLSLFPISAFSLQPSTFLRYHPVSLRTTNVRGFVATR